QIYNFPEGKSTTYTIAPVVRIDGVNWRIKVSNLPEGASLSEVPDQSGSYSLTWAPPLGTLALQERERNYAFQIELEVVNAPDDEISEILRRANRVRELSLRLIANDQPVLIDRVVFEGGLPVQPQASSPPAAPLAEDTTAEAGAAPAENAATV